MTDIVERIRSLRYVHVPVASQLFDEACAEITRLRLTDPEVRAVEAVTNHYQKLCDEYAPICEEDENTLATLRGLLERLK